MTVQTLNDDFTALLHGISESGDTGLLSELHCVLVNTLMGHEPTQSFYPPARRPSPVFSWVESLKQHYAAYDSGTDEFEDLQNHIVDWLLSVVDLNQPLPEPRPIKEGWKPITDYVSNFAIVRLSKRYGPYWEKVPSEDLLRVIAAISIGYDDDDDDDEVLVFYFTELLYPVLTIAEKGRLLTALGSQLADTDEDDEHGDEEDQVA